MKKIIFKTFLMVFIMNLLVVTTSSQDNGEENNEISPITFISNKDIEDAIIEEADSVYLAESKNTMGNSEHDNADQITKILDFRDNLLRTNKKIKSFSINNKVYEVMDSINL